jgi:hypothetical protein
MTPEEIFSLCNGLALLGWVVLIFIPSWKKRDQYVLNFIIMLFVIV